MTLAGLVGYLFDLGVSAGFSVLLGWVAKMIARLCRANPRRQAVAFWVIAGCTGLCSFVHHTMVFASGK